MDNVHFQSTDSIIRTESQIMKNIQTLWRPLWRLLALCCNIHWLSQKVLSKNSNTVYPALLLYSDLNDLGSLPLYVLCVQNEGDNNLISEECKLYKLLDYNYFTIVLKYRTWVNDEFNYWGKKEKEEKTNCWLWNFEFNVSNSLSSSSSVLHHLQPSPQSPAAVSKWSDE